MFEVVDELQGCTSAGDAKSWSDTALGQDLRQLTGFDHVLLEAVTAWTVFESSRYAPVFKSQRHLAPRRQPVRHAELLF